MLNGHSWYVCGREIQDWPFNDAVSRATVGRTVADNLAQRLSEVRSNRRYLNWIVLTEVYLAMVFPIAVQGDSGRDLLGSSSLDQTPGGKRMTGLSQASADWTAETTHRS